MAKLQESIDALETLVERNDAAVTAALAKISQDVAQLEEQKDDPEEVAAISQRLQETISKLEAAVSTNPEQPPAEEVAQQF